MGKSPGKSIPGRGKNICKDPEVEAMVDVCGTEGWPVWLGESERKIVLRWGSKRWAEARSCILWATGRTLGFFFNSRFIEI